MERCGERRGSWWERVVRVWVRRGVRRGIWGGGERGGGGGGKGMVEEEGCEAVTGVGAFLDGVAAFAWGDCG